MQIRRIYLHQLLFFLGCFAAVQAQDNQIRFDHITAEDGLSEAVINCIFQDSRGFMWFGTNDGLNRYDGYNFTVFKPSPDREDAISSNLIFAMAEDSNQKIWIGTTGSGLSCFNPFTETFCHYQAAENDPESLYSDQIITLYTDSKERMWVGTLFGLNLLIPAKSEGEEPKIIRLKQPAYLDNFTVQQVIEDKSGIIWLATRQGLYRCLPKGDSYDFDFQKVIFEPNRPNQPLSSFTVDKNGMLLIASHYGTYQQINHHDSLKFVRVSDVLNQQTIITDKEGKVWVGTYEGLLSFKP